MDVFLLVISSMLVILSLLVIIGFEHLLDSFEKLMVFVGFFLGIAGLWLSVL